MKKIMYFDPKTCRYTGSEVLKIEGDVVYCKNKYNEYTESLQNLKELSQKPNPDWHGAEHKPLIKII